MRASRKTFVFLMTKSDQLVLRKKQTIKLSWNVPALYHSIGFVKKFCSHK